MGEWCSGADEAHEGKGRMHWDEQVPVAALLDLRHLRRGHDDVL